MPPSIVDLSEFETRRQKIDVLLKEQGWPVGDRSKVIAEVDTKQSNFRTQNYRTISETLINDLNSKYVDYLLLDSYGGPIAIIEAKRTSKDPILTAQRQAEEYANDIKSHTGKYVFIFLSNGYYGKDYRTLKFNFLVIYFFSLEANRYMLTSISMFNSRFDEILSVIIHKKDIAAFHAP
jgi:type I site-specific restriction endonuclease